MIQYSRYGMKAPSKKCVVGQRNSLLWVLMIVAVLVLMIVVLK